VEAKACDVHVLRPPRYFKQLQDTYTLPDMLGTDPACLADQADFFEPFVPESAV
jgi:hypothetical protein